ncbi:MAG: hypothetical protein L6R48_15255 [Planctomycetes bacterium]|nr:hypothetical protein [Planctomycetota bacterium]
MATLRTTHLSDRGLLAIEHGGQRLELALQGAASPPGGIDAGTAWDLEGEEPVAGGRRLRLRARRTCWDGRWLLVDLLDDAVLVRLLVRGHGTVDRLALLAGYDHGLVPDARCTMNRLAWARRPWHRWWSGSPLAHARVFGAQPEAFGEQSTPASLPRRITCATTFGPERFDTFFAPAPYVYVLDRRWALGLVHEAGRAHYHHWDYQLGDGWGLELDYDGRQKVDGEWTSPALRIAPCAGDLDGVGAHLTWMRAGGHVPPPPPSPDWAFRPIFCGWGQQTAWAHLRAQGAHLPVASPVTAGADAFASEDAYGEMLRLVDAHRLPVGTLTIDAGWSRCATIPREDPERWRDLRGFIAAQHRAGRKVLLWLGTWNPGGLDEDLRMAHAPGERDACDPTNPEFRRRLAAAVERCVAPGGLDADGFKLDFTGDLVRGAGYRPAAPGPWGLELLHDYVALIHGAMRAAKADTVLETHCAHPAFAPLTGMLRLNDIFSVREDVRGMMRGRAALARLVNPGWAIDADADPFVSRTAWRDYMLDQPDFAVPSLMSLTHVSFPGPDGTLEAITAADLAELGARWRQAQAPG